MTESSLHSVDTWNCIIQTRFKVKSVPLEIDFISRREYTGQQLLEAVFFWQTKVAADARIPPPSLPLHRIYHRYKKYPYKKNSREQRIPREARTWWWRIRRRRVTRHRVPDRWPWAMTNVFEPPLFLYGILPARYLSVSQTQVCGFLPVMSEVYFPPPFLPEFFCFFALTDHIGCRVTFWSEKLRRLWGKTPVAATHFHCRPFG